MKLKILALILIVVTAVSCTPSSKEGIRVEDAWARAANAANLMELIPQSENTPENPNMQGSEKHNSGSTSAIYLVIYNDTQKDDRLIGARTAVAEIVEIHETRMENDIMRMQQVEGIDLPARSEVELKPGGYHIMLINLKQDLKVGEKIPFTLIFEMQGEVNFEAEVRAP